MRRNSYALAALAAAAVPGLDPVRTVPLATPIDEFDVAGVIGADGHRVVVTAPSTPAAGAHLEKDVHVCDTLAGTSLASLVPEVLGFARLAAGGRAVVSRPPAGVPLMFDALASSRELAQSLGRTIARIHAVPVYIAESAGVETFTAGALRTGHRAQITRAQELGSLPPAVTQRWQSVLADDELWDLRPCFVHGSLSEESLLRREDTITAVMGWHEARTGDPAADLAWLVAALAPEQVDILFAAYTAELPFPAHPRLLERAQVLGEFAVVDWLLHGHDAGDETIVSDARGMLSDLDEDLAQQAREAAERTYDDLEGYGHRERSEDEQRGEHGEYAPLGEHGEDRARTQRPEYGQPGERAHAPEQVHHSEHVHHAEHAHRTQSGSDLVGLGEAETLDAQHRADGDAAHADPGQTATASERGEQDRRTNR